MVIKNKCQFLVKNLCYFKIFVIFTIKLQMQIDIKDDPVLRKPTQKVIRES